MGKDSGFEINIAPGQTELWIQAYQKNLIYS